MKSLNMLCRVLVPLSWGRESELGIRDHCIDSQNSFNCYVSLGGRERGRAKQGKLISVTCLPVPPEVTLLPDKPVELGEPNTLICFIDKFSPPVISVTWLRNGRPVTDGVSETIFLPRDDNLFRKFHYLPFLPTTEDVYDCKVEHWGLDDPLLKHWGENRPSVSFTSLFLLGCTCLVLRDPEDQLHDCSSSGFWSSPIALLSPLLVCNSLTSSCLPLI